MLPKKSSTLFWGETVVVTEHLFLLIQYLVAKFSVGYSFAFLFNTPAILNIQTISTAPVITEQILTNIQIEIPPCEINESDLFIIW